MQKVIYAIGVAFAVLIVVGVALPRHTRVEVSAQIDAPPATVFALINDFRRVSLWSPFIELDPNARVVYSGPKRGVGARMNWDGAVIGSGRQVITVSQAYEHVATAINPGEQGAARTWFVLRPTDGGTTLKWGFESDHGANLLGRYFAPMLARIVERDFGTGLGNLKDLAESLPDTDFSGLDIEHVSVDAAEIAFLPTSAKPQSVAISEAMGAAISEILAHIDAEGLEEAGPPLAITRSFSGPELLFDTAIPVRGVTTSTPRGGERVRIGFTYAGPAVRVRHVGPYRDLAQTHRKIAAYLAALGIDRAGPPWESYVTDPTRVPAAELVTEVYYPVRD